MNTFNIEDIIQEVLSYNPKAQPSKLKKYFTPEELQEQFGTSEYKVLCAAFRVGLSTVPKQPCGNYSKFKDGKFLNVCTEYVLGVNSSCAICHENKTRNTVRKIKETSLQKYGTEFPNQNSEVKEKIKNNSQFSTLEMQSIQMKREETNLERYGAKYSMHVPELKDKQKQSHARTVSQNTDAYTEARLTRKIKMVSSRISDSIEILYMHPNNNDWSVFKCTKCNSTFKAKTYNKCTSVYCINCEPKYIHVSKAESEVLEFIRTIYSGEVIQNVRDVIPPLELDIYIPEKNIAIEYNGCYYHSDKFKPNDYHTQKHKLCADKGIKLISIFDTDWLNNRTAFENKIHHELAPSKSLYARKCSTKEISSHDYKNFCAEHHLQGAVNSSIRLGLFYEGTLVSVMGFSVPRFSKKYQYELIRFCSSTKVQGGASKLLKYFERNYNPRSLVTYANQRWSCGDLYRTLGFNYVGTSRASYFYYKSPTDCITRYAAQKHKISTESTSHMTEAEIMKSNGYVRVYDCGNSVHEKIYTPT